MTAICGLIGKDKARPTLYLIGKDKARPAFYLIGKDKVKTSIIFDW